MNFSAKTIALAVALVGGAFAGAGTTSAMPIAPDSGLAAPPVQIEKVGVVCGPGFHLNPYGHCVRNWGYGYGYYGPRYYGGRYYRGGYWRGGRYYGRGGYYRGGHWHGGGGHWRGHGGRWHGHGGHWHGHGGHRGGVHRGRR